MREKFIKAAWEEGFPMEWATHWFDVWERDQDEIIMTPERFNSYLHRIEARRTELEIQEAA